MPDTQLIETEPSRRVFIPKLTRGEIIVASAIMILGLALRIRLALITYLNPDEATHALYSFTGWREMFRYSYHIDKHPPLLLFLTHLVLFISRSDLAVRLIPVLSGSLFPVFFSLWLSRVAGKFAAMTALFLLTFSPHFVIISAQLRGYTLAFLFLSASLVAFEFAIDTGRLPPMIAFDLLLFLCICSDYSMAWFAGPAGIYALMRLRRAPFSLRIAWAAGQLLPLIVCVVFFWSNRRRTGKSLSWLADGFPGATIGSWFPVVNTAQQFGYAMASLPLGILAWVLFSVGVFFLWTGRTPLPRDQTRALACLFTLPFVFGIVAAYAGLYPYGTFRQSLVIGIFGVAGLAVFAEFAPLLSRTLIASGAVVSILIWLLVPDQDKLDIPPSRNRKSQMVECLNYMHATIPPDALIVSNDETLQMLVFYEGGVRPPRFGARSFNQVPLGHRWRVGARGYRFSSERQLQSALAAFRAQYGISDSQPVWVLAGGFKIAPGAADPKLPFTQAIHVFHTP